MNNEYTRATLFQSHSKYQYIKSSIIDKKINSHNLHQMLIMIINTFWASKAMLEDINKQ